MKGQNYMTTTQTTCPFRVLYHHFTSREVKALYDLIMYMGWIPHSHEGENDDMRQVVNRICEIAEPHGMATRNSKTT